MKFDSKGIRSPNEKIIDFEKLFIAIGDNNLWNHKGLTVEIDPTIDYSNENVLIRWTDINEGFNDKIIYHNLAEFKKDFQLLNA